ncbi:MAG: nucleotidyltransferase family protein [Clostridia bacterium]|nr:nucleotidyltransferase family protein [Clostridia bacterium]
MTLDQSVIINLVKSAITGETFSVPEDFSVSSIIAAARRHKIENLVYYGLTACGYDNLAKDFPNFNNAVLKGIYIDQKQAFLLNLLTETFQKNEFCFSVLKGPRLKKLYPKSDMREMSDLDVLVKVDQFDRIRPVLLDLGFVEHEESIHEMIWTYQDLKIEFHKQLIPSNNKDYFAFFGDGWDFVKPTHDGSFEYEMSKEDEFLFLFVHIAKHFRDSGIGIRYVIDLWLCRKAFSLDEEHLEKNFEKLNLTKFYHNFLKTTDVWFEGAKDSDITSFMTDYIFSCCVRGTNENSVLSTGLLAKKYGSVVSGKKLTFLRLVFPDFRRMTVKYPVLKKAPVLLPFCYIARWFEALFFRRDTISKHTKELEMQTDENIKEYEENLKFMGIEYCFEEDKK